MTYHHVDAAIAVIARVQHGCFSRSQAVEVGATQHLISNRVHRRAWFVVDADVFALASHPFSWEQRVMAATLGERQAVASGKTAAVLHGFSGFRQGRPEITVPKANHHSSRIATVRRSDLVRSTRVQGIAVNDPVLTLFEIAGRLPPDRTESVLEEGLRSGLFDIPGLQNQFVKQAPSRRPGIAVMRALLDVRGDAYVPATNELEELLYGTFGTGEFGLLVRQPPLPWRTSGLERCDGLLVRGLIILESDGRPWHTQVSDFANDRRRDNEAIAHGYCPMRWTWVDLKYHSEEARDTVRRVQAIRGSMPSAA